MRHGAGLNLTKEAVFHMHQMIDKMLEQNKMTTLYALILHEHSIHILAVSSKDDIQDT